MINRRFSADSEEEFDELRKLYFNNHNIISEFISEIINSYLFPNDDKLFLMRADYLLKMEQCNYLFVKPIELRLRFTDFVYQNRVRAMLPARQLPYKRHAPRDTEDYKNSYLNESSRYTYGN